MKFFYNKTYRNIGNAFFVLGLIGCTSLVSAQQKSFAVNNNNPLKSLLTTVKGESHPFFVDIDGDNDLDCFVGERTNSKISRVYYFRNDGSAKMPVFKNVTGAANPLADAITNALSIPNFVDIDDDGDYDCFISDGKTATLIYLENTGTKIKPIFEKRSAAFNPLSLVKSSASVVANAAFADVDGDGDYDCLVTDEDGVANYFVNEGTASAPSFKQAINGNNPFSFLAGQTVYNASFQDWNKDGMADLFVGAQYFQNSGSRNLPEFSANKYNQPVFESSATEKFTYTPFRWVNLYNDNNTEVFQGASGKIVYQTLASKTGVSAAKAAVVSFSVFPNPSSQEFVLTSEKTGVGLGVLRISDVQGRVLSTRVINENTARFGKDLKPGLYTIQVLQNEKSIYTQKIIKE